ncbi:FAD-dependent oxidoreductase [Lacicoccus alkaliphilus]|uniref:Pyruvate/2-oxoglutarate dehydrogenase complex, dihydrolipoamide dehydrogenase (E3) component n=1 Tax=Lacicoccus alkaliphilus DSM 16010 TaxID=1123231 RepID=A0A1M7KHB1_9BACL|nr:FAD-dependent oxidoreductase [Salinicoccus alkaliphilus]SHM64683.1 Pyruvate/2-oxoglutarate dehydrogenase complex, dihydrolipoamide dehydrogenase (E3) component [Salinicoccus alkaliphilus DSM 16010]
MNYDIIIIGFGTAGKALAGTLGGDGKKVAIIEESPEMYGGACINTACIPSKTLMAEAGRGRSFKEAVARKADVVDALNEKSHKQLAENDNVDIYTNSARFKDDQTVELLEGDDTKAVITAGKIVINTGAKNMMPEIDGIDSTKNIFDPEGIMTLDDRPDSIIVLGAGYTALEFISLFSMLGTDVTVIDRSQHVLIKEDKDIGTAVYDDMVEAGIKFVSGTEALKVDNEEGHVVIETDQGTFKAEAMLVATGRKPNTEGLALQNAGVALDEDGAVEVDDHLLTTAGNIYAAGDVKGGSQFTYISHDDFRIVYDQLKGEGERTTENRGAVPYTVFIDPPFSRVGMTASQAKKKGHEVAEGNLPVREIPRHKVDDDARGVFKAVVDKDTDEILGASLYGRNSEELINIVKIAIDHGITATALKNNVYTHPTMAESFNSLFDV